MLNHLSNLQVAIASGVGQYPSKAPFDPPEQFPELPFRTRPVDPANGVYPMVRESLKLLKLDIARFGTSAWNPLGEIISPGDRVLIKPNFVLHRNAGHGPLDAVVTHASVLRPIADYVLRALQGRGTLIIGDAPQMNCDMATLFAHNGMDGLVDYLTEACAAQGVQFAVKDFRQEQTYYLAGIVWSRKPLPRGAHGTIPVTLGPESFMDSIDQSLLYGADYDRSQTTQAHTGHRHEYRIASEVLQSDVIISVPKLKVHSKVGTTLNIKNMVGINTDKNHLAHYRIGPRAKGGDEFSNPRWYDRVDRRLSDYLMGRHWEWGKYPFLGWKFFLKAWKYIQPPPKDAFGFGNWRGNDTAWRMALDLNRVLLTSDALGTLQPTPIRKYFSIIDGIVGGQGDGPLHPDAFPSKVVLAGFNPLAVDWVATNLMGLDPSRIPMYVNGAGQMREWVPEFGAAQLKIASNTPAFERALDNDRTIFRFATAPGWRGSVERYKLDSAATPPVPEPDPILQ
ncbi:MAG TPA: DUF362 domain-containing protein [Terriglobales bacterium]